MDYLTIELGHGLAQGRRQAIIWIDDGIVYCRIYSALGLDGLRE